MIRISPRWAVAALPLALAACGGGGSSNSTATPPTATTSQAFVDKFGTTFAADFNAATTTEPKDPAAADVPALNLTAEPIDN